MTAIPLSHDLTGMIVHFSNLIIACDILSQMDECSKKSLGTVVILPLIRIGHL